jgi:ComF family protein
LDALLPPRCFGCGSAVPRQGELCAACWGGLRFVQAPFCRVCGRPLVHAAADFPLCAPCSASHPAYDRARSALAYDEGSRGLILAFKHRERLAGVATFVAWMTAAGGDLLREADVVAPVPLHRWRLLRRGFNQCAVLGAALARSTGRPWCPDLLVRHTATASQQRLGARARQANVTAAAFAVSSRMAARVRDAAVLLIDDVLTTGATVSACAEVLRRHGAARIDILTLARVVRDSSGPI